MGLLRVGLSAVRLSWSATLFGASQTTSLFLQLAQGKGTAGVCRALDGAASELEKQIAKPSRAGNSASPATAAEAQEWGPVNRPDATAAPIRRSANF